MLTVCMSTVQTLNWYGRLTVRTCASWGAGRFVWGWRSTSPLPYSAIRYQYIYYRYRYSMTNSLLWTKNADTEEKLQTPLSDTSFENEISKKAINTGIVNDQKQKEGLKWSNNGVAVCVKVSWHFCLVRLCLPLPVNSGRIRKDPLGMVMWAHNLRRSNAIPNGVGGTDWPIRIRRLQSQYPPHPLSHAIDMAFGD
jgi:hypothetical protein